MSPHLLLLEAAAIVAVFFGGFGFYRSYAVDTAGGSDPYGYVSEARLLSDGHVVSRETVLSLFGVPENSHLTYPLGYAPHGPDEVVPTYPFGYPLLLALAIRLGGLAAAFAVTPLLGAGTVVVAYLLGRSQLGPRGGVLTAGLVALLPNLWWSAIIPMSDVPATFFAALALWFLLSARFGWWGDLGLAAAEGIGIWVRPNLALLLIPTIGWLLCQREGRRLAYFCLGIAPFLALDGALNLHLYGAPWTTGYGDRTFDSLDGALPRGLRYLQRLQDQQGGIGLVVLALGVVFSQLSIQRRVVALSLAGLFLVFFAFFPFDGAWWYGRYVLPAFPAVALVEAGGINRLLSLIRFRPAAVALLAAGLLGLGWSSVGYAQGHDVFRLAADQHRYQDAAALVASQVHGPALILAMEHSGSLRFYGGFATARYDVGPLPDLLTTLQAVSRNGGPIYLLAENWELDTIRGSDRAILLAGAQPVAQSGPAGPARASLFRLHVPPPAGELHAQHDANAAFGDEISLLGYDLSGDRARPGDDVTVTLYWQAIRPPTYDYSVFIHVDDPFGRTLAQSDSLPVQGTLPPTRWPPGFAVTDVHRISLPKTAPAGPLRVIVGLYRTDTMERLWPSDAHGRLADNFVTLGPLSLIRSAP
jgi:Dolichyl-phosphate-mannose-protein mannosyltransferase